MMNIKCWLFIQYNYQVRRLIKLNLYFWKTLCQLKNYMISYWLCKQILQELIMDYHMFQQLLHIIRNQNFGNVEVLKDYSLKLPLVNDNQRFIFMHSQKMKYKYLQIFRPIQKHDIIKTKESCEIEVLYCADDAQGFTIDDIEVQLKAKGIGFTIFCKDDLSSVHMGINQSHIKVTKEIFIENKGRKQQKLQWTQKKPKQNQEKLRLKKQQIQQQITYSPGEESVFSIAPDTILIPLKHVIIFKLRGYSQKKVRFKRYFVKFKYRNRMKGQSIICNYN